MASVGLTAEIGSSIEVFPWLKTLPVAPEYHPTLAEFEDPIAYIFKIEKEASRYGICKIVPPVPSPPKKTAIGNLNRSLVVRSPDSTPTFTTRQQQIGFCPRKHRPVQKPVWQSGESYTLAQFEAKAKSFEKNYLKKSPKKVLTPLEIETLYWKATVDKPFSVEYANDMPGSAFAPLTFKKSRDTGEATTLGETAWNMRGVSRAEGSLLRFMREEIPGVTSPMVYIAMMFSWFAWHVEDHDLHSLNYLHMGAGKTWYGVPKEAAVAFEEVIRVHGYGGEINPLVTFATLGEKTTVMSPEVLLCAGIPCCRLVQNAGEFVVTFPRAYHSGFSHGFNCGEAANISTPGWLTVAKDAAIRRASINCPPMVSHFQLLYDLVQSFCSRIPKRIGIEPRSSRLKDKKKGEGETLVKELFVKDLVDNNKLLYDLGKGSSIVLLPRHSLDDSFFFNKYFGSHLKGKPRRPFGSYGSDDELMTTRSSDSDDIILNGKLGIRNFSDFCLVRESFSPSTEGSRISVARNDKIGLLASQNQNLNPEKVGTMHHDRMTNQGLFSCVTCGILCYACVAVVQPTAEAACFLMSADCSVFNDWRVSGDSYISGKGDAKSSKPNSHSGWMAKKVADGLFEVPIEAADHFQTMDETTDGVSNTKTPNASSSLGLLALAYGDSSDSEEDLAGEDIPVNADEDKLKNCPQQSGIDCDRSRSPSLEHHEITTGSRFGVIDCRDDIPLNNHSYQKHGQVLDNSDERFHRSRDCSVDSDYDTSAESNRLHGRFRNQINLPLPNFVSNHAVSAHKTESSSLGTRRPFEGTTMPLTSKSDEDSSRLHVFCLQHAVEVEHQLREFGGVHISLLCHPDYPKFEAEAKSMAGELGIDCIWTNIAFREATEEDREKIQTALDSEEVTHGNGDWAVKLGINLYYSANLSRSPLYSKQMPYNYVIYHAFGRNSPSNSPTKSEFHGRASGKQKKIVVAGKWCGRVWMSNQVHPLLVERDFEEPENERCIPALAKPDAMLERVVENNNKAEKSSAICKNGREVKSKEDTDLTVRATFPEADACKDSDDLVVRKFQKQYKRNPRNKRKQEETPPLPLNNSEQTSRQLDAHCEDEMASDDSLLETCYQQKRNLRNKQMKNDANRSRKKSKENSRQLDSLIEDEGFDDSPADDSLLQLKRNSRTKKLKKETVHRPISVGRKHEAFDSFMEDEQASADDSLADISRLRQKRNLRSKQMKKEVSERVDDSETNTVEERLASDDSLSNRSHQQRKRNLRSKQAKKETPQARKKCGWTSKQFDSNVEDEPEGGPSTRLRKRNLRPSKEARSNLPKPKPAAKKLPVNKKVKKAPATKATTAASSNAKARDEAAEYCCDIEGCTMSFGTKQELVLHKRDICPVKGCGKKFFSHKYLVQHRRVHVDDRPLKCPWRGCKMTFKWAWARTEHIRVHTGARPYVCTEAGCGQTFRFVSDFSRHKRKTGHSTKKGRG